VVIEAVQFDGSAEMATAEGLGYARGGAATARGLPRGGCYFIDTLEGLHVVSPGDWIITGIEGERYPCKPAIFAATYEPVGEHAGEVQDG
jgi:hypothetical protein